MNYRHSFLHTVLLSKELNVRKNVGKIMKTPRKILICGYSHCGTTILKSIIGHIEEVEEIINECDYINKSTNKKYIMCKSPQAESKFFGAKYKDYVKIFIIRNPLFVFSSINKRYDHYNLSNYHSIEKYIDVVKMFILYKNKPEKNIYTIKYEDLFEKNYYNLKKILDNIGIKYSDHIFDNSRYTNFSHIGVELSDEKPKNTEHEKYRTWQINQPFNLKNDISKLDLSNNQIKKITNNRYILQLYPDVNSTF